MKELFAWLQRARLHPLVAVVLVVNMLTLGGGIAWAADAQVRLIATSTGGAQSGIGVKYKDTGSGYVPEMTLVDAAGGAMSGGAVDVALLGTAVTVDGTGETMPTSALANRKTVLITNNGTVTEYCGGTAVTASSGTPVVAGATLQMYVGPDVVIRCITASSSTNTRVLEGS